MASESNFHFVVVDPWDDRDKELDLRYRLANIVAEKVSGIYDSVPEDEDFQVADNLAGLMNLLIKERT